MVVDKHKILIVDNENALRVGLSRCAESAGFEPLEAADGSEALRIVDEHKPDLILLDVMMNGMSGLEVCRLVRKNPEMEKVKIIILSAKGQLKEQEEGLDAGADRYITKPFDYRELIDTIKELLEIS